MANMTFKASLLPNTNLGYSLGSETQNWKIYGAINSNATLSGDNFAAALQTYFDNNKTDIARNSLLTYYSSAYGNGTQLFGYFLSGYNDSPYGGFFAAHYNTPKYIGISNGTYTEQTILTNTNYSTTLDERYVNITGDTMTGLLKITTNSNTLTLGSQNGTYCHFSSSLPYYLNNTTWIDGHLYPYGDTNTKALGSASKRWQKLYIGTADSYGGTAKPIYWNAGVPTAITATIGNSTTPAYVNAGTLTAGYPYLRYINTNDATTWTADTLAATDSIAFTRVNITGAYTTGHMVWFNAKTIGTPFQLVVHDSSDLYLYKRYWISADSKYSAWTKMNAGYADSAGTATTCSYPLGFSGRNANCTWGNQTGATITSWHSSSSGAVEFRNDNPSSGKLSIKVDGRFYGNEGTYPAMLMQNKNSYWGMGDPDGADTVWIRTTSQGIIPYQGGAAGSGHGSLGTSSWYFSACYADNDYAVHQRSSGRAYAGEWIEFAGADGLYFPNSGAGTHFYPNTSTTYGGFQMQGKKGGYMGFLLGNTADYMNVMDDGVNKGFFQQGKRWPFYYNRTNDQVGIFDSSCQSGYNVTIQGTTYITGQTYVNSHIILTGQVQRGYSGRSWVAGRDGAIVRMTGSFTSNGYMPITSCKSINGSWEMGTYTANNSLYFTYITDANYSANSNNISAQMEMRGSDNSFRASKVWGAVWNDYAEMREVLKEIEPGRCVREVGDDTMVLSTARLQRGCKIISDTFGFNIGETETAKTPIAVSGRALVYLAEDRETARSHIGWPVCSGPNGTVSIMTEEEEEKYPSRIVGTISSVPDYEEWGTGKVKVNGRIWIYIR